MTVTPWFSMYWVTFAFGRLREGQLFLAWRDGQFEQHDPAVEKIWEGEAVGKKMIQSCVLVCQSSSTETSVWSI